LKEFFHIRIHACIQFFRVFRKVLFRRIPVDGSTKMPDDYMDSIEPFDYSALTAFSTAYLPGFLADKYDVSAEESSERADLRAENSAIDCLRGTVEGYESVSQRQKNIQLRRGAVKYALLPVWLLTTKWNGENYLFAMNGQTGRLVGDLPISKGKLAAWFAGLFAVFALLGSFLFEVEAALLGGAFIAVFACAVMAGMMKTARRQTDAHAYISATGTRITGRSDRFLHRTVQRYPIQNNNSRPGPGQRPPVGRGPGR